VFLMIYVAAHLSCRRAVATVRRCSTSGVQTTTERLVCKMDLSFARRLAVIFLQSGPAGEAQWLRSMPLGVAQCGHQGRINVA
jgi:hypothetical protein